MTRLALLAGLLWLGGCAGPVLPAAAPVGEDATIPAIAVGPVVFAVRQPDDDCALFLDEELRSAVVRELRRRGYPAQAVGDSVPRSFAAGPPPPLSGMPLPEPAVTPGGTAPLLLVWIDEYWANTLCGWEGPKYLTMGAEAVLYAGSPPREVWRNRARTAEQGGYGSRELIWLTTSRLADGLLESLPAGLSGPGKY